MTDQEKRQRLYELFFQYQISRGIKLTNADITESKKLQSLAYYTTAETAMKIFASRNIYLRNATVMNDYSEMSYGYSVVSKALQGNFGKLFDNLLNEINPTLALGVRQNYEQTSKLLREDIFTASLSEQDASDPWGRLSMWRAYGGPVAGVALIFKAGIVDLDLPELELDIFPVIYGDDVIFTHEMEPTIESLNKEVEFLRSFPPDVIANMAYFFLEYSLFTIKHPGFHEEKEWRVIRRTSSSNRHILAEEVTLGGIPQRVYKLPFHNPSAGDGFNLPELDLNEILDSVMIGPCAYPETVRRALHEAMVAAGIHNPDIRVSNIPLRQRW